MECFVNGDAYTLLAVTEAESTSEFYLITDIVFGDQLLELFATVNQTAMAAPLRDSLKIRYTDILLQRGVTRQQVLKNWQSITEATDLERELLKKAVNHCADLLEVTQAEVEPLLAELTILEKMAAARMVSGEISFRPWQIHGAAGTVLNRVNEYVQYRGGEPRPALNDKKIRAWAAENLRDNSALMFLIARTYGSYRESLIPELARKQGAVSKEQILALYVAGCPKSLLCKGAGGKTAQSWQDHIEALFPGWTTLPHPVSLTLPSGLEGLNKLLIGMGVLLALACLLPAGLMLLLDAYSMLLCIGVMGVLGLAVLTMFALSFALKKKGQQLFLRIMSAAMIPGLAAAIVCFVMNLK